MDEPRREPFSADNSEEEDARIRRGIAADSDTFEVTQIDPEARGRLPPHLRVGRPCGSNKTRVTTMLDNDVIAALKASGEKGWQTRLNATLREALDL